MNLLARGPEQSLLAAVLCDRPSKPVTHTPVDWPQSMGYLTFQGPLGNTHMSGGWVGYHLGRVTCLANYLYPPPGGMGYMVSWAEVLRKVCVIFEIVDSNAQVSVEKVVHRRARWPQWKDEHC